MNAKTVACTVTNTIIFQLKVITMCALRFEIPQHYSSATAYNIVLPTQNKARKWLT